MHFICIIFCRYRLHHIVQIPVHKHKVTMSINDNDIVNNVNNFMEINLYLKERKV